MDGDSSRLNSHGVGVRKAATLLIGLGSKAAAAVFKELNDQEIELITREMSVLEHIPSEQFEQVVEEFQNLIMGQKYMVAGGVDYARDVLVEALDSGRAMKIIDKLRRTTDVHDIGVIGKLHPEQFIQMLSEEHPQTVAFIISQLDSEQAGNILSKFDEDMRNEIIIRLTLMKSIDSSLVGEVEHALSSSMDLRIRHEKAGGADKVAAILNFIGQKAEKSALKALEEYDEELAKDVEKRMFVFDIIIQLDDNAIQRLMRDIEMKDLAQALKVASDELKQRIHDNMSERARNILNEEVEYLGRVRLSEVEAVQQQIAMQIKKLVEAGEIALPTSDREVYV